MASSFSLLTQKLPRLKNRCGSSYPFRCCLISFSLFLWCCFHSFCFRCGFCLGFAGSFRLSFCFGLAGCLGFGFSLAGGFGFCFPCVLFFNLAVIERIHNLLNYFQRSLIRNGSGYFKSIFILVHNNEVHTVQSILFIFIRNQLISGGLDTILLLICKFFYTVNGLGIFQRILYILQLLREGKLVFFYFGCVEGTNYNRNLSRTECYGRLLLVLLNSPAAVRQNQRETVVFCGIQVTVNLRFGFRLSSSRWLFRFPLAVSVSVSLAVSVSVSVSLAVSFLFPSRWLFRFPSHLRFLSLFRWLSRSQMPSR